MQLNLLHKSNLTPHVRLHHVASPLFRDPRSGRISQKVGWLSNLVYKMAIEMLLRISSDDGALIEDRCREQYDPQRNS